MMSKLVVVVVVAVLATLAVVSCRPAAKDDPQVMCKLPMVKGYCRALLPRWKYDPSTGKCVEFKYGGCNGNANNFMTQKACLSVCEGVS